MYYHQCHLQNLNNSNLHQRSADVKCEPAALNILPQAQDREYQPHANIYRSVMALQRAMLT